MPRNIKALTGIRGFAALWVALFHTFGATFAYRVPSPGSFIQHGFRGVDIFFVLSGFVLTHVYETTFIQEINLVDYVRYLGLRLARIYPLHLATMAAAFGCYALSRTVGHGTAATAHFSLCEGVMNLALLHAWGTTKFPGWNDLSWSISAEWFAYLFLLAPCIRLLRSAPRMVLYALTAALWCAVVFVYVPQRPSKLLDMTYDYGALRVIPEFVAGYVAYQSANSIRRNSFAGDLQCLIGLAGIVLIACHVSLQSLLLPACMLLLIGLSAEGPVASSIFGNRIAVFLGEVSYSIYMCHVLVLIVIDAAVKRLHVAQWTVWGEMGIAAGSLVAVVMTAYCLYVAVERPFRSWGRTAVEDRMIPLVKLCTTENRL